MSALKSRSLITLPIVFVLLQTAIVAPASAAPPADARSQTVLAIDEGASTLSWGYYCTGDYNQDGEVNISDLTAIGQHWQETVAAGADDSIQAVVDGNDDGEINISDITPIGSNFGVMVQSYNVYTGDNPADAPDDGTLLATVNLADATGESHSQRLTFTYSYTGAGSDYFWVRPTDGATDGIASNLVQAAAGPQQSGQIDIRLASSAADPGTLAVRIFSPEAGAEYFAEGAPVVVNVPGGTGTGTVEGAGTPGLEGFIQISYSFPGSGAPPYDSGGVFDDRGQNCIDALRDVMLFALGSPGSVDTDGWTLQQLTAADALSGNVGIIAGSNGGPLTMVTLSQYGEQLGGLAWYVGWENPTGSQLVMPDAGPANNRVGVLPPGTPKGDYVNPQYNAWDQPELDIDYSNIAFDPFPPDSQVEMVYLERGGLPRFDVVPYAGTAFTSDLDGDGVIGPGEDWGLGYWTSGDKRYYSLPAIRAVWNKPVFTSGNEPVWLPTIAEAEAFWQLRDSTLHFDTVCAKLPHLNVMLMASVTDHVQRAPDHPHIRHSFDGFDRNGNWFKLNPSPESFAALEPSLAGRMDLPDLDPNVEPADWSDTANYIPDDIAGGALVGAAGVREMAELAQAE